MKKDIHPDNYRLVIFEDSAAGKRFLIKSTVKADAKGTWEDGNEYPLVGIEVSSASHPFYTGEDRTIDKTGRVERFKARAAKAKSS